MKTAEIHFDLFNTTPYLDHLKKISLRKFVLFVVLLTWLPLIVLSSFEGKSLLLDITVTVRFLILLPLLMLTPYVVKEKIWNLVDHFLNSKIVSALEEDRFHSYVRSTLRLRDSATAKMILWVLIYTVILFFAKPTVQSSSLADGWFRFVSQPIYLFVQLFFIYRALLWWRFLFLVSRLDLQLKAAHGDDAGGLAFLGGSIRIFNLPAFLLSASVAVRSVSFILYEGGTLDELKIVVAVMVAFFLLLFISPLCLFHKKLISLKAKSALKYGVLAHHQLREFENKWLDKAKAELSYLEAQDFSTVTDSTAIVNKVNTMRTIPFQPKALVIFVVCIVLPFLPIVALKIPWAEILKRLLTLVV
jgi:hypothetical protein